MERKSDKHGPRLDDEMKHEPERGDGNTRAQGSMDPETGRDRPAGTSRRGGAPPGMTPRDVENRSALAQVLSGVDYPATPHTLARHAIDMDAPDIAVTALEELPEREYADLADVVDQLGHGHEERRF